MSDAVYPSPEPPHPRRPASAQKPPPGPASPPSKSASPQPDPRRGSSPARGADLIADNAPRPSDADHPRPGGGHGTSATPPGKRGGFRSHGGGARTEPEPEGSLKDKAVKKGEETAGKLADKGLEAAATSSGIPYRQVKDLIANSAIGRKLVDAAPVSKAFKDGFLGRDSGPGKGRQSDSAEPGSASGSARGTSRTKALAVGLPLMAVVGVLLVLAGLLTGQAIFDGTQTQPSASSDNKVEQYLPAGWENLLKNAAATTAGQPDYAQVPWTVLAGIVQTQTDFGRYSPYDNIDRDPGRTVAEISPGGSGTDATSIGVTSGAGPGPIQGVSGPGESTSISPDHPGPPPGDLSHQLGWFMYALRMHESGGDYTAGKGKGGACGAYQYETETWVSGGKGDGYPTACDAPPSVQDKRAIADTLDAWRTYHTWQQVAAHHFYPAWAASTQNWQLCPAACGANPTVWEYVDDVMKRMRASAAGDSGTRTAPAVFQGGSGASGAVLAGTRFRTGAGVAAGACQVANPSPDIGGKDTEGTGPFLLTPAAAADMRSQGADPNNPCDSARYVAQKLAAGAKNVYISRTPQIPQAPSRTTSASLSTTDYPWDGLRMPGGDQWGMGYGQCVSFVAWMIYKNNGGAQRPAHPGIRGWFPSDGLAKSPVREDWGNAGSWNTSAANAGFAVDGTPKVGSVAQWLPGTLGAASTVGHVAYVTQVYSDGSIDLAQYNFWADSTYSTAHLARGGGWDASNGHSPVFVKWPDNFLHIYDDRIPQTVQPASNGASKPTGTGTSQASVTGSRLWVPNGNATDMANARRYWSLAIDVADIFADRSAKPGRPCALPPADPKKPWSVSFKITYIWRCEIDRMPDLYLVTGGSDVKGKFTYTVETDRYAAAQALVSEALSVSYGAGRWKTACDNKASSRQGIFPMTKEEANAAGVTDRCDQEQNIDKTAGAVLSVEKMPPGERDRKLGDFQPMIGGWQQLSIAMGQDLEGFAKIGPGDSFTASDACTAVMRKYLTTIAPYASAFATLTKPPTAEERVWSQQLGKLNTAHNLTPPYADPACHTGSWAPGYESTLAQVAIGLAGKDGANAANLNGLADYFEAAEQAGQATDPVPGKDTLVIPRLASYPLNPVNAPIAPDTADVWSELGNSDGVSVPLDQLAVEYAWFYGGVIAPFDSAGKRIGSLSDGSTTSGDTTQVSVGPDGCPQTAPRNTLLYGADKIGIQKLCADSVAQARTPQAAMAIKWALKSLGWPYTQDIPARDKENRADCSSFVSRAYLSAIPGLYQGNAPTTDVLRAAPWTHQIPFSQVRPGDLVEPESGHVVMHLADGYNVQESHTGEVSHVLPEYSSAFWAGWVDASKA